MRLLIATGIFPPDIGGPALVAENLAEEFKKGGLDVKVLCYSEKKETKDYDFPVFRIYKNVPKVLRYFLYFTAFLRAAGDCDFIYALSASPGISLPPLIFSKIFRKKFLIRPGGDFFWERAAEKKETDLGLKDYYQKEEHKKRKIPYLLFNFILQKSDFIIFPTDFLRDLYLRHYHLKKEKTEVIGYPFPRINSVFSKEIVEPKQILFAGRLIRLKNLPKLIEAFSKISSKKVVLKIVGEGPQKMSLEDRVKRLNLLERVYFAGQLSHAQLLEEIKKSYLAVIPSIFELGSFFALECIKLKTPVLLTKETGLYASLGDKLIFINPFEVEDIRNKIEFLLNEDNWRTYLQQICRIDTGRSWTDVAEEHIKIFKRIL